MEETEIDGFHSNQTTKRKGIQSGKEEVKLPLFADDMILYTEDLKDFTKKQQELISEFSKAAGYKINVQKSIAFQCTNNEAAESEIKTTTLFTMHQK